jgi:hypothetical protein
LTRLRSLFADIHYDCQRRITDHVIVSHAMTMKVFAFGLTKAHPAHFEREKLIGNTGVRLLAKDPSTDLYADYGTLYEPEKDIRLLTPPAHPIRRHYTDIPELDYAPEKMDLLRLFFRRLCFLMRAIAIPKDRAKSGYKNNKSTRIFM